MLTLDAFSAGLIAAEPEVWGDTVRATIPALCRLAVSGAKDHFRLSQGPDGRQWAPLAHPRPRGGDKPLRDRGLLMASLSASKTEQGLRLAASHPGANLHQFGGTVKPKRAKMLAIPVSKEAVRSGPARSFPRPLFVLRGTSGAVLAEVKMRGKGRSRTGENVVHYVLARSVKVPARPFVGFSADTLHKMTRLVLATFQTRLIAAMEGRRQAYYSANPIIT